VFHLPQPARRVLAEQNIPYQRVAEHAGCSVVFVSGIVNGKAKASPRLRAVIAEMTGTPEVDLFRSPEEEANLAHVVAVVMLMRTKRGPNPQRITNPAALRRRANVLIGKISDDDLAEILRTQ
jgi:hypothetical protein